MHVAIDDTYGPETAQPSRYVTGDRRTYVAIEFPDGQVDEIRDNLRGCLAALPEVAGVAPAEFHFADIYNRRGAWKDVGEGRNLAILGFFASIYRRYRWRVHIQTVDDRTLADHGLRLRGVVDGIDVGERDGQALFFLLVKLKHSLPKPPSPVVLRLDAGRGRPGDAFAGFVFREWGEGYDGRFASSHDEPLIQIADFLAFSINRSTHLQIKATRSELDVWFLELVAGMGIDCVDLVPRRADPEDFVRQGDEAHREDRRMKGLE